MIQRRSVYRIAIFAGLMALFDAAPGLPQLSSGVWYGWTFVMEPLIGIFFSPMEAFYSALIGVLTGHVIGYRGDVYEFFFAFGAPIGASITSLIFRRRSKPVVPYYFLIFAVYFLTPISRELPIWALWDTYIAFFSLLAMITIGESRNSWSRSSTLILSTLIGLEADILFRILIFVPFGTFEWLYGFPIEFVQTVWAVSAVITPIQVGIAIFSTVLIGRILANTINTLKEQAP